MERDDVNFLGTAGQDGDGSRLLWGRIGDDGGLHARPHPYPAAPPHTSTSIQIQHYQATLAPDPSLCYHPSDMNPMSVVHTTTTVQSHVVTYHNPCNLNLWGSVSVTLSPPRPFSSSIPHRQWWSRRLRCRARSSLCSSLPLFMFFAGFCWGLVKGFLDLGMMCFELVLLDVLTVNGVVVLGGCFRHWTKLFVVYFNVNFDFVP